MANFLSNLGAVIQGQQNYQDWDTKQEQAKLRIENEKENLANIKDLAAQAKKQRARETDVAQGTLDVLTGIPFPPPQPPAVQPPPPGQQSQPMIDPGQAQVPYPQQQRSIGPQGPQGGLPPGMQLGPPPGPPQGGPPQGFFQGQQQGYPPGPPQGQQGPQGMPPGMQQRQPPGPPPGPPPIPPYQTVQGASGTPPQQGPQGIPPPPPQQPGQPRPNSMSIRDAANFIKAQGIKDPITSLQVLDRLTPYLNDQAKQEAEQYKIQLNFLQTKEKLEEDIRHHKEVEKSASASVDQKREASQLGNQSRILLGELNANIAQQRVNNQTLAIKDKIATGQTLGKDDYDLMADQVLSGDKSVLVGLGRSPKDIAGVRASITRKAKEQGLSGSDLSLATAGFEGLKAGERTLGTRTANIGLAGNEAALFAKNAVEASDKVNRTEYPTLNKALESWRKGTGNTDVVDLASYTNSLINAYARAVSPSGAPTVSDKEHAREILSTGFSKNQYQSAVNVILKEIEAAKKSPGQTKEELGGLFKGGKGAGASSNSAPALPDGWTVKVK